MRYQYKHGEGPERPLRPASLYHSPINKHYSLAEDKQWIRIVCSVEALIIPILIKVSVCLKHSVCVKRISAGEEVKHYPEERGTC